MGLFTNDTPPPPAYGAPPGGNSAYGDEKKQQQHQQIPPNPQAAMQQGFASGSAGPGAAYMAVLMSSSDKLRFLNVPAGLIDAIRPVVQRAWPVGIQQQGALEYGGYEFKLKGRPWYGQGAEAVPARRLMIHLLHGLAAQGWHMAASTDLSKKAWDKDTLFFRSGPPVQRMVFCLSFNEYDKMRLIDAPDENVKRAFVAAAQTWPLGIQQEKQKEHGCYQIKLRGNPWATNNGTQVSQARMLAIHLLTAMDNLGYELAACIDMSIGVGDEGMDIDSWFFASKLQ